MIVNERPGQAKRSPSRGQRDVTRARISQAAMEIVAQKGFDATVEEIAQLSGVSARTIFRHYESHDRLIASTVRDILEACGFPPVVNDVENWVDRLPHIVEDVEDWIDLVALIFHTRSAEIFGAAFWDIHAPRRRETEALAEIDALRCDYRTRGVNRLAELTWHAAGGVGDPPEDLALAFALHLSVFTTQALMVDFDQTPVEIGALTADILKLLTRRSVEAQRSRATPLTPVPNDPG